MKELNFNFEGFLDRFMKMKVNLDLLENLQLLR